MPYKRIIICTCVHSHWNCESGKIDEVMPEMREALPENKTKEAMPLHFAILDIKHSHESARFSFRRLLILFGIRISLRAVYAPLYASKWLLSSWANIFGLVLSIDLSSSPAYCYHTHSRDQSVRWLWNGGHFPFVCFANGEESAETPGIVIIIVRDWVGIHL